MKVNGWILGWMIFIGLVHADAHAQTIPYSRTTEYLPDEEKHGETYEQLARPLRLAPKERFKFSNARLVDVIRLLAAEAGIPLVSKLDESDASDLITITFELSPFSTLEAIAKDHDFELIPKDGTWSAIYPASGKIRTVTYEHPYSGVNTTENQKQWPEYVDRLFRPHDRPHDTYFPAPTHPIVEIDFSLVQIETGHDEILLGPQKDGPVTKIIQTDEDKSQLEALLKHSRTLTISQRKLALQPYRNVLLDHLSSEIVDGTRRIAPDPNYVPGTGINLPIPPVLAELSVILPRGTQVALQCNTSDDVEAILHIDTTQAGLRKGPEKNPTVDMLFTATQHRVTVKAPIGETVVIGSFEKHSSLTNIHLRHAQKARKIEPKPNTRTILLIRPTKVIGLEWAKQVDDTPHLQDALER